MQTYFKYELMEAEKMGVCMTALMTSELDCAKTRKHNKDIII